MKHLTFISHYTECTSCKQALLNAAAYIPTWGFGGLYVFADGHVLTGYATSHDAGQEEVTALATLDAYLTRVVSLGLCHDLNFLVWDGDKPGVISAGKDHLGPFVPLTATWQG